MIPAPTINLCLPGVTLCVGYSCMCLCQGCVSVQLGILTVDIETPSHRCKALAFSAAYSSAQPRWLHWLSGDPQVLGCRSDGKRRALVHLGRERQSMPRECPGQSVPLDSHSTQRSHGCARLSCQGLPSPTLSQ